MNSQLWRKEITELVRTNEDEVVRRCLQLSEHSESMPDAVRLEVAGALFAGVQGLLSRGNADAALTVAGELGSRFAQDPNPQIRARAAAARMVIAGLKARTGQLSGAIETYDQTLSCVAGSDELVSQGASVAPLLAKGRALATLGRLEDANAIYDEALAAIKDAPNGSAAKRTRQAAVAVVAKLENLIALDRIDQVRELSKQLRRVVEDLSDGQALSGGPAPPKASESSLAAALAETMNDPECWDMFEGTKDASVEQATEQAVRLYDLAEPWLLDESADARVREAASVIRTVADGYALLAGHATAADRETLPLPELGKLQHLVRERGIEDWANGWGHPLHLGNEGHVPVRRPLKQIFKRSIGQRPTVSRGTIQSVIKILYLYDLVRVLRRWQYGREALQDRNFSTLASSCLRFSFEWVWMLGTEGASDGRVGAAGTCLLIAEGLFLATHQPAGRSVFFPAEVALREVLHEEGGYAWLVDLGLPLPAWTDPNQEPSED